MPLPSIPSPPAHHRGPADPGFIHLHVASGFSMRYGASTPEALVQRAAAHGQPALALTDRDGLYGAIRFATAATRAGIAPVLGVDLAVDLPAGPPEAGAGPPTRRTRTPARGGAVVDARRPRVVVLARGRGAGVAHGRGWAALARLVTDTHLGGLRGTPVTTPELVARWCRGEDPPTGADPQRACLGEPSPLLVLLGPDSDVGRALLGRRRDLARARLAAWRALLPSDALAVEVVDHGGPEGTAGSCAHAALLLGLADEAGVPAVLTAAVRHADPGDVRTVDILDAARRLVVLDSRHLDRVTDAGHLASTAAMHRTALEVTGDPGRATALLATTVTVAGQCTQDARRDLGIGAVHLPEPGTLGIPEGTDPQGVLAERCRAAVGDRYPGASERERHTVLTRLDEELAVVADLGYPTYFLSVAAVVDLVRDRGIRVAARGSGAGSLVNYLLGISGVDPIRYDLLMERFCSPLRAELPDIDIDVESARRTEIYQAVIDRFGAERVSCVSMMDTYKVRHAIRDVGAALGMAPGEIDEIATAFPHIAARNARDAIADLPELRSRGLDSPRLARFFDLVESLDGLPRHIALHPSGVILSNATLLDRTPVEQSGLGFPMSQFDKDDVETLGLLKLDVLGIRMQSAMAHAVAEVARVDGVEIDLDDQRQVPLDDEATYRLIRTTHTLGCFQIESPGQRELVGKLGPVRFEDLIIDISLFRPGPVKSDMITPFLEHRHGWSPATYLHPSLVPALAETEGVVVFHEQVLRIVAETTGVSLAQADEVRRTMGTPAGQAEVEAWWRPAARARGYSSSEVERIWEVLAAFASFGFCKAHAAAFALPTYHSAWLKTHHPAAFLAGVLTHDPGMYPRRLILDDARSLGIAVLPLDVNASGDTYRVERLEPGAAGGHPVLPDLPDASDYGIRLSLADVLGMSADEVARVVAGQPFADLVDFWTRARVSRPVVERLVLAGAFDSLYGMGGAAAGLGRRGRVTRRDVLLHVAELDRWDRSVGRSTAPSTGRRGGSSPLSRPATRRSGSPAPGQLVLDLGDRPELTAGTGLPEMTGPERVRAELDILGLDASSHVMGFYDPLLRALGVVRSRDLLRARSRSEIWVAGVKVATQTPPVRSGRRVVFLTLDDGTGPVDVTFFEDVQGPYAATVFHSWLLLARGVVRRTGERGISLRATGAWELAGLWDAWSTGGLHAVRAALGEAEEMARATAERATEPEGRRVLVHASGFKQSPYADTRPAGTSPASAPRRLWHASPGSSGH